MRSIHTTNQQDYKNNTPYRVIHKHRTKLGNPIRGIIVPHSIVSGAISIISIISLLVLSLCLSSTYTHAESSVSLSVDNSDTVLELNVPDSVNLSLTPSSTNNYIAFDSTRLSISAGTNNPTGYTLTMSVPNTNLVNSSVTLNSNNNPNDIPLDNSNHPIIPTITNTYSDSNFPNNAWGYRLSTNTDYFPIPSTLELANTNIPGNAIPISLDLAAKINSSQPAGKYITTFNFAATAKQSIFTIIWNANGGTVSPATSTHRYGSQIGTLPEPTYTGYDFLGWFTQAEGGEQISETTTVTADVTYWAQWEKANPFNNAFANAGKSKQNGYYTMQDMTASICGAVTTPTTTTEDISTQLIDTRDNKIYWVSKLLDGNCWMTQDLDLDLSTSFTLKPEDTDVTTDYTPSVNTTTRNIFNSSDFRGENSWDGGDYYWKGTWGSSTQNSNLGYSYFSTYFSTNVADAGDAAEHYHVGNFYQWSAATAKTGNYLKNGKDATSSICPKGWRLPTSGDNTTDKSFGFMLSKYSLTSSNTNHNINNSPLFFVSAGLVNSGKLYSGAYGSYWSSRARSEDWADNAYYLGFDTSSVYLSSGGTRYTGHTVRCVAR